jgi:hypothetical protein
MENLQIRPEQALAAFEAKMEMDELAAYQHEMEQTILQPQKDFRCVSVSTVARHFLNTLDTDDEPACLWFHSMVNG